MLSDAQREKIKAAREAIQRQQDEERKGYANLEEDFKKFDLTRRPLEPEPQSKKLGDKQPLRFNLQAVRRFTVVRQKSDKLESIDNGKEISTRPLIKQRYECFRYRKIRNRHMISTRPSISHRYYWKEVVLKAADESANAGRFERAQKIAELNERLPKGHNEGDDAYLKAVETLSKANHPLEQKAMEIYESIGKLPTGYIDGNDPDGMTRDFEKVRELGERIKQILTECLETEPKHPDSWTTIKVADCKRYNRSTIKRHADDAEREYIKHSPKHGEYLIRNDWLAFYTTAEK